MRLSGTTFGRRLAAIREHRGLTQEQLGTVIGKSKQTICRWESDPGAEVDPRDVAKCARVLHCGMRHFLAPLYEPLPPCPLSWPRIRNRIIAATGVGGPRPNRRVGRAATVGRISKPRPMRSSALDQAIELLPELTAGEVELLLEMKKRTEHENSQAPMPQI
jgi:transcriptional regulator with XRE-family HTH domain